MARKRSSTGAARRSPARKGTARPSRKPRPTAAPQASGSGEMRLSRLDQVKVMAHPLRLRMLTLFGEQERTAKQVAEILGEKPTRLYHHVDAMARVGLLRLTRTRQVRGATEKYYRAAARRFEIGGEAFAGAGGQAEAGTQGLTRTVVEAAREEALRYFAGRHGKPAVPPVVARAVVRGSREEIEAIRKRLMELLDLHRPASGKGGRSADRDQTYTLSLLFHPKPEE